MKDQNLQSKADRIRELLIKLKKGFDYMDSHPDEVERNEAMIERAKPIFDELETLGVNREYSLARLLMGPSVVDSAQVRQFLED